MQRREAGSGEGVCMDDDYKKVVTFEGKRATSSVTNLSDATESLVARRGLFIDV